MWVINTHNGIKGIKERINVEQYPSLKSYLDRYWDKISKRSDMGDTPYNLRNCAYVDDFSRPKLVWGEISDKSKFAIDLHGKYCTEATTFFMIGEHLEYLMCLLNSPVSEWYFSKLGTTTGMGTIRWKKYTVEQLFAPIISNEDETYIKELVLKNNLGELKTEELKKMANNRIYKVLGLEEEEIQLINDSI